jgi:histidyl-tRNA synthetase
MKIAIKSADVSKPVHEPNFAAPRGTADIWGGEWLYWDRLFKEARKFAEFYDFTKIETPLIEEADLFIKTAGEATELIERELLATKNEGLALRPEMTVGVVRAYVEHKMSRTGTFQKFWYEGPVFRNTKTGPGKLREFHQVGFEIVAGANDPAYDAQVALIFWKFMESLKLKNVGLTMNSVGCKICRPIYIRQLQNYYKNRTKELCEDCERRFKTNPLRLLECRKEHCMEMKAEAPNFFDKLCSPCSAHFRSVLEYLDELGIPYALDNFMIQGVDYYSRTVFNLAITEGGEEFQSLASGGRYDYLFETFGMKTTPGVGGALVMETIIAAMKAQNIPLPQKPDKRVFIIHVGEMAKRKMFGIMETLREAGVQVSEAISKESLQAQLKAAGNDENKLALILGQKEVFEESIIIRDLKHSTQETVPLGRLVEEVKKRLK